MLGPRAQDLKDLYKTVWEIKQKVVLDMAADRGAYIDQSQSLNHDPTKTLRLGGLSESLQTIPQVRLISPCSTATKTRTVGCCRVFFGSRPFFGRTATKRRRCCHTKTSAGEV